MGRFNGLENEVQKAVDMVWDAYINDANERFWDAYAAWDRDDYAPKGRVVGERVA